MKMARTVLLMLGAILTVVTCKLFPLTGTEYETLPAQLYAGKQQIGVKKLPVLSGFSDHMCGEYCSKTKNCGGFYVFRKDCILVNSTDRFNTMRTSASMKYYVMSRAKLAVATVAPAQAATSTAGPSGSTSPSNSTASAATTTTAPKTTTTVTEAK